MYEKFMSHLTAGYRLMIGAVLLLAGIIWQLVSDKQLDMYAFYIMAAAMLCFVNVIISKMSKSEPDFILFLVLNMAVLIIGFALTESENIDGMVMYGIWGICVLADWILNAVLITCTGAVKRTVMGFIAAVLNVLLISVVFIVPILIAVFV